MPAIEPLIRLFKFNNAILSKEAIFIIELELFICVYTKLTQIIRANYSEYFSIMKFCANTEQEMIDDNFLKLILNDLVLSEAYSLQGIAYHIQEPEDVVYEVASGHNTNPSFRLSRKIIELHRSFRPDLYRKIIDKLIAEHIKNIDNS